MSKPLSLPNYKKFIRSLNFSQDQLTDRYNSMQRMYIQEQESTNDPKVLKFLEVRKQFLADEAMKKILA